MLDHCHYHWYHHLHDPAGAAGPVGVVGGAGVVPGMGLGHLQTQYHRIVRHAFILLDRLDTIDSTWLQHVSQHNSIQHDPILRHAFVYIFLKALRQDCWNAYWKLIPIPSYWCWPRYELSGRESLQSVDLNSDPVLALRCPVLISIVIISC